MKKIIMTALMLSVALCFSVAVSHGQKTMGNKAGLEKAVNTFFEFVKANNVDKIETYYTNDYTFTGPDGKMVGVEERLKGLREVGSTFQGATDISVRTYGTTGVATGIATTKNESGGTVQSRFIQVWTWQRGRWRLAASHVTRIA